MPLLLETSNRLLDTALREDSILSASQHENIRKKARDLHEGRAVWESVPFRVILETNRRCNIRCTMCDNVHTKRDELATGVIERLYEQIGWGAMELQPHGAGEPTLAPMEVLAPLARRHNQYFNFITNGVLFTREFYERVADCTGRVQFSIHSHRREVAERIAVGQPFDRVIDNLRDTIAIAARTGTQVLPSMVLMHSNFDDVVGYIRFMADLGVQRLLLSRLFPTSSTYAVQGIELHRTPAEIDDMCARALEGALACGVHLESNLEPIVRDPRNRPPAQSPFDILQENAHIVDAFRPGFCVSTSITILVEWDGTVLPCYRDRIVLGNIYEQSFEEIWNGEVMRRHRAGFFDHRPSEFCSRCQAFFCGHA